MKISKIEELVIKCLKENLILSEQEVPQIDKNTRPSNDISGFDSLRAIEVLMELEEAIGCDLPPEQVFSGKRLDEFSISNIAKSIDAIKKEAEK